MPELYLLRHAKSDWSAPGRADRDRPLAERGVRAAEAMGGHLDAVGLRPEVVFCSPAVRTRETLELVIGGLGHPRVDFDRGLYGAGPDEILDLLRTEVAAADAAMVVGHNPTMAQLALWLTVDDGSSARMRVETKFPTGALAILAFEGEWGELAPGSAGLVAFTTPRDLGVQ